MTDTPYEVVTLSLQVAGEAYDLRALKDRQQFWDPSGEAEAAGVAESHWSLFGVMWDSARILAERVARMPLEGRRVLEIGCGLGLVSLVAHRRGADILAADYHPLAGRFLAENAARNGLSPVPFKVVNWERPQPSLGAFDLVLASDVLYERWQAQHVADFMARRVAPGGEVILVDPRRGNQSRFHRAMLAHGFVGELTVLSETIGEETFRGHIAQYRRPHA